MNETEATQASLGPGPEAMHARARGQVEEMLRRGIVVILLLMLAASAVVGFVALLDIVDTWFEHQYVPIARAVLAVGLAGACVYGLRVAVRRA